VSYHAVSCASVTLVDFLVLYHAVRKSTRVTQGTA
jgi:hypothetical protein